MTFIFEMGVFVFSNPCRTYAHFKYGSSPVLSSSSGTKFSMQLSTLDISSIYFLMVEEFKQYSRLTSKNWGGLPLSL